VCKFSSFTTGIHPYIDEFMLVGGRRLYSLYGKLLKCRTMTF
jgi:hypothetical protein